MKFKRKLMVTAVAGIAGAAQMANAAEAPQLEEVIVTAQKIEENLQKIPVTVTALSAEALKTSGIASLSDLQNIKLPGLNMQPFSGRNDVFLMNIRGITTADPGQGTTDSGVALVVDDVPNARGYGVAINPAELERIEVLRGPQGTLFGRNAVGGAVRMITKGPSGEFGGNAKLGVTNYNGTTGEVHLNTQEINGLSFKFDYREIKHDGFTKNPSTPNPVAKHRDYGEVDADAGKISVQLKATDSLKLNYSYEDSTYENTTNYYQHDVPPRVCQGGVPCGAGSTTFTMPVTSVGDYQRTAWKGSYNGPSTTKYKNHRLGVEWQLQDNLLLKSITSHTESVSEQNAPVLNGAFPRTTFGGFTIAQIGRRAPAAFGTDGLASAGLTAAQVYGFGDISPYSIIESKTSSQEFQLIGNTDAVKWIAGLYWFKEESRDRRDTAFTQAYTGWDPVARTGTNLVATNPWYLAGGTGPLNPSATDTQSKVEAYAAFVQATWTPATMPQWHFTGGLRFSHDHRKFHRSIDQGLNVNIDKPDFNLSRTDPLVSVAYDVNETTNVYARYASAYRAGGASVRLTPWSSPTLGRFATYQEEVDKSIEAGIKSDLMDRRLRLNAAVYFTKSNGPILSVQLDPAQPSNTGTINLPGTQKIKGFEMEADFAATERLTLGGNMAWQKYEFSSEVQNYIRTTDPGSYYAPAPFPKYAFAIKADYVMPVAIGQVAFHIDWNKTSKGDYNTSRVSPGNYVTKIWNDVTNARVTWRGIKAGQTTLAVSAYAKNLMNQHTPIFTASSGQWMTSDPRMVGLEVGADF